MLDVELYFNWSFHDAPYSHAPVGLELSLGLGVVKMVPYSYESWSGNNVHQQLN